jgi:hypothetical protein
MSEETAQPGEVPVVEFRELKWTAPEQEAIDIDLLEQDAGPRFQRASKRTVLNLHFWGRLLAKQLQFTYEPPRRCWPQHRRITKTPAGGCDTRSRPVVVNGQTLSRRITDSINGAGKRCLAQSVSW